MVGHSVAAVVLGDVRTLARPFDAEDTACSSPLQGPSDSLGYAHWT
jgi:hypothetical protein